MEIPVFLFTGFLEAGKTKFIQETLEDKRFNDGARILLILCEEGIEEYNPELFASPNVFVETIDEPEQLTEKTLKYYQTKHNVKKVMIEYNGMWMHSVLYDAMPKNWIIYQEFMFADYNTFLNYNANMRSLMVDKLQACELVVINRSPEEFDVMPYHKIVRGINRSCEIAYERKDGQVKYDDIEDPLPFDINADIIEINDRDYAYWYRDLSENPGNYENKKVRFTGIVAKDGKMPRDCIVIGRHVMTCCAADIAYAGLLCHCIDNSKYNTRDWLKITASIEFKYSPIYRQKGPILTALCIEPGIKPDPDVATFN